MLKQNLHLNYFFVAIATFFMFLSCTSEESVINDYPVAKGKLLPSVLTSAQISNVQTKSDVYGFEGVSKKEFIKGNYLKIKYRNSASPDNDIVIDAIAELTSTNSLAWTLNGSILLDESDPEPVWAIYEYDQMKGGDIIRPISDSPHSSYMDLLKAIATKENGIARIGNQYQIHFQFTHIRSLLYFSVKDMNDNLYAANSVMAFITDSTGIARKLLLTDVKDQNSQIIAWEAIAPENSLLDSIHIVKEGKTQSVLINGYKLESGKKYPVNISVGKNKVYATINTSILDWDEKVPPFSKTYGINSAEDLISFRDEWNAINEGDYEAYNELIACWSNPNGIICLNADIDLNNIPFEPIGTSESPFSAIFDGQGHTIKGLKVEEDCHYAGLFGLVTWKGRLQNLHVVGDVVSSPTGFAGGIVGSGSVVLGCTFKGNVKGSVGGGIAGSASVVAVSAFLGGSIEAGNLGGIAGRAAVVYSSYSLAESFTLIQNSTISPYKPSAGGIVGLSINGGVGNSYWKVGNGQPLEVIGDKYGSSSLDCNTFIDESTFFTQQIIDSMNSILPPVFTISQVNPISIHPCNYHWGFEGSGRLPVVELNTP